MDRLRMLVTARHAYLLVVLAGTIVMLAMNYPGQTSWDSISQLHEGLTSVRETWGPVVYSAILAFFARLMPGTGLYLVVSALLFAGALAAMPGLRSRTSWAAPVVVALLMASPDFIIFQGDIWKDVMFSNLVVASFVLLAHVAAVWPKGRRPWFALGGLLVMLALAAQVRQNGLIAAGVAALALAWSVRAGGWRSSLAWGLGGLVAVVVLSQTMAVLSMPRGAPKAEGKEVGIVILQRYDVIGTLAHDPTIVLEDIRQASPKTEAAIRSRGVGLYSPERIDYLGQDPFLGPKLSKLPPGAVGKQWLHLILHHPGAYLAHRLEVFRWVFLTPYIDSCLPIYVGVDGPENMLRDLKMTTDVTPSAQKLYNYGTYFLDSPVYSHLSYALVALAVAIVLLLRREPTDVPMAGLMIAALGFAASFFLISIACDYRYLYMLDMAALTGLAYLALDPPMFLFRRR